MVKEKCDMLDTEANRMGESLIFMDCCIRSILTRLDWGGGVLTSLIFFFFDLRLSQNNNFIHQLGFPFGFQQITPTASLILAVIMEFADSTENLYFNCTAL